MSQIIEKLGSGQIVFLIVLAMACVLTISYMVLQVIENELERRHPKRRVRKAATRTPSVTDTRTDLTAIGS